MKTISQTNKKKHSRKVPPDEALDYLMNYLNKKYASKDPDIRELYQLHYNKTRIKFHWYKKLKLRKNETLSVVGAKEIMILPEVIKELDEELTNLLVKSLSENHHKLNPNQAILGTAKLIRDFESKRTFTKSKQDEEHILKLISFLKAELDFFKMKKELGNYLYGGTENKEETKLNLIENDDVPKFNLKKEVEKFATAQIIAKNLHVYDKYFVRDAKKKFIALKRNNSFSQKQKDSIRTYLQRFKTAYKAEDRKGKGKKRIKKL